MLEKGSFLKFNSEENRIEEILDVVDDTVYTIDEYNNPKDYNEKEIRIQIYKGQTTIHKSKI